MRSQPSSRPGPMGDNRGRLGEYKIVRKIAEGAHATVKLAIHTLTGTMVALKFLDKTLINDLDMRSRVSREIQYLRLLSHPHIIKLYEVIDTPASVVMVMEYAEGELFYLISRRGRVAEATARGYFQQIMYALAYSHSLNIVHRDLKPENVLLDDELNVKIGDFGLSNEWQDGDWLATGCGTPNYCAPEIIDGKLYGVEIDVWSCGAILYVMICGQLPYEDDDLRLLFQKIRRADFPIPNYLSPEILSLLKGMMTVDPTKRMTVSEVLDHPWTKRDSPRYLRRLHRRHAEPPLESLSTLLMDVSLANDPDFISGIGKLDIPIILELAEGIGVTSDEIRNALRLPGENAVKVAYSLCSDRKYRHDLKSNAEPEQDDSEQSSTIDTPMIQIAPLAQINPNPKSGNAERPDESDVSATESDEVDETGSEEENHNVDWQVPSTFAIVKGTSTPSYAFSSELASQHNPDHSLASSSRLYRSPELSVVPDSADRRHVKRRRPPGHPKPYVWHFGLRSVNPPMEVVLELYQCLQRLGIEWKEKRGMWAASPEFRDISGLVGGEIDKNDLDIFTVDIRWRKRDSVVLMALRLFRTGPDAYLVDFQCRGHYKASTSPDATSRFERDSSLPSPCMQPIDTHNAFVPDTPWLIQNNWMNPFLFFECACELIVELTGLGEE